MENSKTLTSIESGQSFDSRSLGTKEVDARVRINTEAEFCFDGEVRRQLFTSLGHWLNQMHEEGMKEISVKDSLLMFTILDTERITLNVSHVQLFIKAIKIKMDHCEGERDRNEPSFSPDSYILMKRVLLDLQVFLYAEVITMLD